jgi:hypothetical protein
MKATVKEGGWGMHPGDMEDNGPRDEEGGATINR